MFFFLNLYVIEERLISVCALLFGPGITATTYTKCRLKAIHLQRLVALTEITTHVIIVDTHLFH